MTRPVRTLELFAGLGGLSLALPPGFELVAALDQDAAAAETHARNSGVPVVRKDLASIGAEELVRWEAPAWLLSPPCQPFTRRGRGRDLDDPRCRGLLRVVELMESCRPSLLLLENVPGFFGSAMHARLREVLARLGLEVFETEACPSELGAPLRRRRQFLMAGRFPHETAGLPSQPAVARPLADFLDEQPSPSLRVPAALRERFGDRLPGPGRDGLLGAFTRAYGRALTGAGPLLWDERGPRWLAPEEILRLHDFPPAFSFPEGLSRRQRWRLAGNSVHVGCVRHVFRAWARREAA